MCCPLLKRFDAARAERHTAAQTAAVSSFLNRTFGKPLHTTGGYSSINYSMSVVVSSSLDGSIYSTVEDKGTEVTDSEGKRWELL